MEVALLLLYAGMLLYFSRHGGSTGDNACSFYVNDRASGAVGVALSLVVSCVGASATMGMAGMAFRIGTPAFWWLGSGAVGITLLALLLAVKVRESGAYTMPEMVESLLGKQVRLLVSVIIVVVWLAILAAQFTAIGKLLVALTGFRALWCLAMGLFLIIVHTLGGQAAVMRADRLQSVILLMGLALLLVGLTRQNPEWIQASRVEILNEQFGFGDLVRYMFVVGGNYLVCPMLFGRFLSAKNVRAAQWGGLLAGFALMLCAILIVAVGLACRGLVAGATAPDVVLTTAITEVFPRLPATLVLLTLISAVVSSADSCLVTASTVLSYDLLRQTSVTAGRVWVVVLGCAGAALTFIDKGILQFLFMAYDIYMAGVVMPVLIALLLTGHRRLSHTGYALAAVAVGSGWGCLSVFFENPLFSYAGMATSALLIGYGFFHSKEQAI